MSSWFGKAPAKWDPIHLDLGPVSEVKDDIRLEDEFKHDGDEVKDDFRWEDFDDEEVILPDPYGEMGLYIDNRVCVRVRRKVKVLVYVKVVKALAMTCWRMLTGWW